MGCCMGTSFVKIPQPLVECTHQRIEAVLLQAAVAEDVGGHYDMAGACVQILPRILRRHAPADVQAARVRPQR
jgi:hypothetical protein